MKFAAEGIKSFFYLNGAASVSILTFIGHTGTESPFLVIAMVCFGAGAACASVCFAYAYKTQFQYGNEAAENGVIDGRYAGKNHMKSRRFISASLVFFIFGLVAAAIGFICSLSGQDPDVMIWHASSAIPSED
ncbi:MAG: hypothetical protein OXJ64_14080 [Boseongicola sp.]|nr:hypothetical protein [Boseongicola sp.]